MMTIISRRHIFKFYLSVIFGTLFFLGMATGLLIAYNKTIDKANLNPKSQLVLILSIACYAFAGYSLYFYIKNTPTIRLDKNFINFNSQSYSLADISKIELTGKRPFKYVINFSIEAATFTFNSGETKYIFDDMYSNSWEIKSFLKQVVIDQKDFIEPIENRIEISAVKNDYYETYKGTVIASLRGITQWGLIILFGYMFVNKSETTTIEVSIGFFCFAIFWFLFHTYLMNYFQVSDNIFVVRNHNFFWRKKYYNIKDIKEVVFETQGKMPNCLRIITKDFRNNLYPAGTLRDKTWLELKDKLEAYKIKVRNECI